MEKRTGSAYGDTTARVRFFAAFIVSRLLRRALLRASLAVPRGAARSLDRPRRVHDLRSNSYDERVIFRSARARARVVPKSGERAVAIKTFVPSATRLEKFFFVFHWEQPLVRFLRDVARVNDRDPRRSILVRHRQRLLPPIALRRRD